MCARRHDTTARFVSREGKASGRKHLETENLDTFNSYVAFKLNMIIHMPGLLSTACDLHTATWNEFLQVTPVVLL